MLLEGYLNAYHAVVDAAAVLSNIEFNARDYYVQGMETWHQVNAEMHARHLKLNSVADDLQAICGHIIEIQ